MWPFLEYFDRKIDAISYLCFELKIIFWCRRPFFLFFVICSFEKYVTDLRWKVPQHSVQQMGLSVRTQKQTAFSASWQMWGTNMTINEAHFSPNTWNVMRAHQPCCQKRCSASCRLINHRAFFTDSTKRPPILCVFIAKRAPSGIRLGATWWSLLRILLNSAFCCVVCSLFALPNSACSCVRNVVWFKALN